MEAAIASRALSSLPLFFFLVLCFSAGTLTSAHSTSSAPADFIRASCGATRYPALCVECLESYAPAVRRSPRQLALAALSVTADRARSASTFVSRLTAGTKPAKSREAGAVQDCLETMRDGVDRLRQSVQEMHRMGQARSSRFRWHLDNVQTWVSAALTDQTTCLDSLAENASGRVRAAIRKKVVEVSQLTSNALALVNRLDPRN
ncbi:pectinesterase inhibitor 9-like [Phoenix dactylifera]|uniref:Pectinesterase inhibitor 9-like n=1 Tax=Phoenix dactylifera TaxID=42345 RepID=A0A8B7BR06_PHODC|nr:pectinesterase inhibitor 9-like [Phoenix dactylifera]